MGISLATSSAPEQEEVDWGSPILTLPANGSTPEGPSSGGSYYRPKGGDPLCWELVLIYNWSQEHFYDEPCTGIPFSITLNYYYQEVVVPGLDVCIGGVYTAPPFAVPPSNPPLFNPAGVVVQPPAPGYGPSSHGGNCHGLTFFPAYEQLPICGFPQPGPFTPPGSPTPGPVTPHAPGSGGMDGGDARDLLGNDCYQPGGLYGNPSDVPPNLPEGTIILLSGAGPDGNPGGPIHSVTATGDLGPPQQFDSKPNDDPKETGSLSDVMEPYTSGLPDGGSVLEVFFNKCD